MPIIFRDLSLTNSSADRLELIGTSKFEQTLSDSDTMSMKPMQYDAYVVSR
jgi:hypothetical protein